MVLYRPRGVLDNLQPPPQDESFRAAEDAVGDLIEYCCFSVHGRVPGPDEAPETLDVSFSMCPALLGEGLGAALARTSRSMSARSPSAAGCAASSRSGTTPAAGSPRGRASSPWGDAPARSDERRRLLRAGRFREYGAV